MGSRVANEDAVIPKGLLGLQPLAIGLRAGKFLARRYL